MYTIFLMLGREGLEGREGRERKTERDERGAGGISKKGRGGKSMPLVCYAHAVRAQLSC